MTDEINAALEAIWGEAYRFGSDGGSDYHEKDAVFANARAAIEAHEARKVPSHITVTEEMHVAAIKVLLHADGNDGLPQRMMDAMLASATPAPQASRVVEFPANANEAEAMQKLGYAWLEQHAPERLKQASVVKQEPVAWAKDTGKKLRITTMLMNNDDGWRPLVSGDTRPAPVREPLTPEQIRKAVRSVGMMFTPPDLKVARAIEAAHGITKDTQ